MNVVGVELDFRVKLRQYLDQYQPGWRKRHRYNKLGKGTNVSPPLGAWAETLKRWTNLDSQLGPPQRDKFGTFLTRSSFPPDIQNELGMLYEEVRRQRSGIELDQGSEANSLLNNSVVESGKFVGRALEIAELLEHVTEVETPSVIGIYGLGGMGKTRLARELVRRVSEKELFSSVVDIEVRGEYFEEGRIWNTALPQISKESIVRAILEATPLRYALTKPQEEREQLISEFTQKHSILVLLDNLEALETRDHFTHWLLSLLKGRSCLLLTSRVFIEGIPQYRHRLQPMSLEEALLLIKGVAKLHGIKAVLDASDKALEAIHTLTGGLPLAMRLVIGQMDQLPFDDVMDQLQQAAPQLPTGQEHPNYQFYYFIYHALWKQLPDLHKSVLVDMASHEASEASFTAIQSTSHKNKHDLQTVLAGLVRMSLVDKIGTIRQERYKMHPITRQFLLGEIIRIWS